MTIEELYYNDEMSVRSYNICRYNNIESLEKLKEYYLLKHSFVNLRNCGRRSNEELIEICNKYQTTTVNSTIELTVEELLEETLANLTRIQREVINSFILVNMNSLAVRNKNAISHFLEHNFSVRNFAENILLNKHFNIDDIKNIGKKSIKELEIYISKVKNFVINVSELDNENQLLTLKNNFLIQQTFSISNIPAEVLQSESIFQLTNFLLKNNAFFNEIHNSIFQKTLKIFNYFVERKIKYEIVDNIIEEKEILINKVYTFDEVTSLHNLSRERVRQIRKNCYNELFEKLSFIKNFNDDLFQNYGIDKSSNLIEVNEYLVNKINLQNKTNFSREFILYILAVYLSEDFIIIGNIEDVLLPKYSNSRNRHNWNSFYIVNKKLFKVDFISFANDLNERINERIEETYSFSFKSFLSRFINDFDIDTVDVVFPIAEKIINDEFELYLDLHDNLVFKRNTIKQAFEYAYEALETLGIPSKVEEITQQITESHPHYETDENKVRASMKRKDGFVPVGRNSIFGLRKWENELDDFKGGTIRSITQEFLEELGTPKHINEITEHVLKYRPNSNDKSIYNNLMIDDSQTFIFFKNSFIGLKKNTYSQDFELLTDSDVVEMNSWEERFIHLQEFLLEEERLPFSNGVPDEEIRLYRWLNVQKIKIKKKDLDKQKELLINEVFENFPPINGRRRLNSIDKYDKLINFIENNQRLPSANKKGEEKLYQFFYNQRKLYDNYELDKNEKAYFSKVNEMLKN